MVKRTSFISLFYVHVALDLHFRVHVVILSRVISTLSANEDNMEMVSFIFN